MFSSVQRVGGKGKVRKPLSPFRLHRFGNFPKTETVRKISFPHKNNRQESLSFQIRNFRERRIKTLGALLTRLINDELKQERTFEFGTRVAFRILRTRLHPIIQLRLRNPPSIINRTHLDSANV